MKWIYERLPSKDLKGDDEFLQFGMGSILNSCTIEIGSSHIYII